MYEQVKALAKLADVHVFCLDPAYLAYKFFRPRTFLYRDVETSHTVVPGFKVEYLRYPALPVITGSLMVTAVVGSLIKPSWKMPP